MRRARRRGRPAAVPLLPPRGSEGVAGEAGGVPRGGRPAVQEGAGADYWPALRHLSQIRTLPAPAPTFRAPPLGPRRINGGGGSVRPRPWHVDRRRGAPASLSWQDRLRRRLGRPG